MLARALCLLVISIFTFPAHALKLVTEENPPFNYTDPKTKEFTGITTQLVKEALKRANVPYSIDVLPWARALSMAQTDPDTCIFATVRLPEREPLFQWVGPLSRANFSLFAMNSFQGKLNVLDDAKQYKIGGMIEDGPTKFVQSKGLKVEVVPDYKQNLHKLKAGHIDLWVSSLERGPEMAAQAGVKDIKPVLLFRSVDHFLACSPKVPETTIKALSQAVEAMRTEGVIKTKKYQPADK